ncbi:hypothetical protein ACA910_006251 [Epithemia clementina (nom. ined.)]
MSQEDGEPDNSDIEDHEDPSGKFYSDDNVSLSFPQRLMEVLDEKSYEDVISWEGNGESFRIHQKNIFTKVILPKHFHKSSKFSSFARKLNRWGFQRVQKGSDAGAYYHPLFRKGGYRLLARMGCKARGVGQCNTPPPASPINSPSSRQAEAPSVTLRGLTATDADNIHAAIANELLSSSTREHISIRWRLGAALREQQIQQQLQAPPSSSYLEQLQQKLKVDQQQQTQAGHSSLVEQLLRQQSLSSQSHLQLSQSQREQQTEQQLQLQRIIQELQQQPSQQQIPNVAAAPSSQQADDLSAAGLDRLRSSVFPSPFASPQWQGAPSEPSIMQINGFGGLTTGYSRVLAERAGSNSNPSDHQLLLATLEQRVLQAFLEHGNHGAQQQAAARTSSAQSPESIASSAYLGGSGDQANRQSLMQPPVANSRGGSTFSSILPGSAHQSIGVGDISAPSNQWLEGMNDTDISSLFLSQHWVGGDAARRTMVATPSSIFQPRVGIFGSGGRASLPQQQQSVPLSLLLGDTTTVPSRVASARSSLGQYMSPEHNQSTTSTHQATQKSGNHANNEEDDHDRKPPARF